jgi:hypothetical protein
MLTIVLSDIRTCTLLSRNLKTRTSPGSRLAVTMSVTVAVAGEFGVIQCLRARSKSRLPNSIASLFRTVSALAVCDTFQ